MSFREARTEAQGMNLEARTEAETLEENYLVACSYAHIQLPFFTAQTYQSRDDTGSSLGLSA